MTHRVRPLKRLFMRSPNWPMKFTKIFCLGKIALLFCASLPVEVQFFWILKPVGNEKEQ